MRSAIIRLEVEGVNDKFADKVCNIASHHPWSRARRLSRISTTSRDPARRRIGSPFADEHLSGTTWGHS